MGLISGMAWGQSGAARNPMVGQIIDSSNQTQDVSKDFLIGSRAAWQEFNAAGGIRGQLVRHSVIEVDGSRGQAEAAWAQLRADANCLACFGSCGDAVAMMLTQMSRDDRSEFAHVAPWLQNAAIDVGADTFPIFSHREQQVRHALQSMATVGVDSISVVYQNLAEQQLNASDIERIARNLKLKLRSYPIQADLTLLASQISATNVPLILFVGGTPELVQFTRGWNPGSSLRYIIALADVNLQVAQQMLGNRHVPIIGTQAVPMVTAPHAIVRRYRQAMAKYFDEPPTALSFAGYLAARYTAQVLQSNGSNLSRSGVYEAFARRQTVDLEGFRIEYEKGSSKLASAFVTQTMLRADGRVIG
jgi:ABC-type branched-subunit amino acid transport system substrate-binding protein